jgi:UDP-glucose 4-epimerase
MAVTTKPARCLVTGGAGFIGSHIVAALDRRGLQTTVLDDLSTGDPSRLPPSTRVVKGDIRDSALVDSLVSEADYVFHLAAYISASGSVLDPRTCFETNTLGLLGVLESARRWRTRKIIFASSCAVYQGDRSSARKEGERPTPASPYAVTKLDGEYLLGMNHRVSGIPYVALRFFNVYGPGQRAGGEYAAVIPAFIQAATSGHDLQVFGDGGQTRDFVYVEDVAEAAVRGMQAGLGVFNVGTGRSVTILELARTIVALTGSRSEVRQAPARAGELRHSLAGVARARRRLGWEARWSLEDGLSEILRRSSGLPR